uniref:Uncharacterized protein n=1 Tax=Acrobeloides nanus TaxID=290746 RepID=A0A914DWY3_9BILA
MELSEDEFHTISIELSKSDTYVEALQDVTNNKHILQDFVDALSPLDPVLKLLEAENYTTINRVLLEFQELKDHFYMLQTDESWVKKAIGIAAYKALQFKQRLCNDVQMLGLMLDPLLKDDITKLSDIDIDAATNMMIQKVKELFISTPDLYARLAPSPYRTGRNPHPGIDPIDVEFNYCIICILTNVKE